MPLSDAEYALVQRRVDDRRPCEAERLLAVELEGETDQLLVRRILILNAAEGGVESRHRGAIVSRVNSQRDITQGVATFEVGCPVIVARRDRVAKCVDERQGRWAVTIAGVTMTLATAGLLVDLAPLRDHRLGNPIGLRA